MQPREVVFDNLIGDLEYHPKRGVLYLVLSVGAVCLWVLAPPDKKLSLVPLVFGAGSLTLLLKGVFFLRKTSDGIGNSSQGLGLSHHEVARFSATSPKRTLPSIPALAAQVIQDFGAGALFLGPALRVINSINDYRTNLPSFEVLLTGGGLFLVGWFIRRLTSPASG